MQTPARSRATGSGHPSPASPTAHESAPAPIVMRACGRSTASTRTSRTKPVPHSHGWGPPTGGALSPSCVGNLGSNDYLLGNGRPRRRACRALHVEPAGGEGKLLRDRRQGPVVQQHRRLCVHAAAGLRRGRAPLRRPTRMKETLCPTRTCIPAPPAQTATGRPAIPLQAAADNFQKLSAPPTQLLPAPGANAERPADVPVELRRGRATLSAAGLQRSQLRHGSRRRADGRDRVHECDVVPRKLAVLYWRVRADDEPPGPSLVGRRNLPAAVAGALAVVRLGLWRHVSAHRLECRSRRRLVPRRGRRAGQGQGRGELPLGGGELQEDDRDRRYRNACASELPDEDGSRRPQARGRGQSTSRGR